MVDLIVMIKKRMVENGRDDFGNYMAEILGISKQCAGQKLAGKIRITADELAKLDKELDFEATELKTALRS